jgi:hypothetical protein
MSGENSQWSETTLTLKVFSQTDTEVAVDIETVACGWK